MKDNPLDIIKEMDNYFFTNKPKYMRRAIKKDGKGHDPRSFKEYDDLGSIRKDTNIWVTYKYKKGVFDKPEQRKRMKTFAAAFCIIMILS